MRIRWGVCLLCLAAAACSGSGIDYGEYPPYPVSGQVLINGKPAKDVKLTFYLDGYKPDNKAESRSVLPTGWTDENGHFVLSTYSNGDGAPAGDYHVGIRWPTTRKGFGMGPDALGEKFTDPNTSGLTAHVEKGKTELKPFEIQAKIEDPKGTKRIIKKGVNTREVED